MKSLKGTQTEKNILTAFAGESQARNRYDFFAGRAKKDGFVLVQEIFAETALQEKEHASSSSSILRMRVVTWSQLSNRSNSTKRSDEMRAQHSSWCTFRCRIAA